MLDGLDHVTVLARDLDASVAFYERVLGLIRGDRPAFGFPGAWLYLGDRPVIHLIGGRGPAAGSGAIDHLAFRAKGLATTRARLAGLDIAVQERTVPGQGLVQLFVHDPDGVRIELNFAAAEAAR
jgi:catechol 2,3-dioxygenase-like lactoylglutathione lyase family enzyme